MSINSISSWQNNNNIAMNQNQQQINNEKSRVGLHNNSDKPQTDDTVNGGASAKSGRSKYDEFIKSPGTNSENTRALAEYLTQKTDAENTVIEAAHDRESKEPENEGGSQKVNVCVSEHDSSSVDAEIAKLNQKKQQLTRQMQGLGDDEDKRKDLEMQMSQIDAEISAKDTNAYRKAHGTVRVLSRTQMDAKDVMMGG